MFNAMTDDPCGIGTPRHVARSDDGQTELVGPRDIAANQPRAN